MLTNRMEPDGHFNSSRQLPPEPEAVHTTQPVAIVGMACRFPKAENLSAFWRLLEAGENGVIEVVPGSGVGRFGELFPDPEVQSESCRFAGFLEGIDLFDAAFFRISPVEADLLDPQQRLMLETSWRALEDAGIDPDRLKGSRTGVYAGISNHDYRSLILSRREITEPADSLYAVSGNLLQTPPSDGSPSPWISRDRRWRWTRPARLRWWPYTRRYPPCSGGKRTSPSPGAFT